LVVEPNVAAFTEAFRRLGDDGLARRLGRAAAHAFWRDPPTPDAHARRLVALYDTMLARRGAASKAEGTAGPAMR
ncbi:MAG TPA: hypothetical protein VEA41_13000, partial [Salinarimonas sp.]|nr:hypothetical protein [Salinarimonas sp.]